MHPFQSWVGTHTVLVIELYELLGIPTTYPLGLPCPSLFEWGGKRICNGVSRHFQQYFSYIVAISFIGGANRKTSEKTTELSQVTDKRYHILLYTLPWSRYELATSVVIGTDCKGSCKSNYQTITATTAPFLFDCCLPRVMSTVSLQKNNVFNCFFLSSSGVV